MQFFIMLISGAAIQDEKKSLVENDQKTTLKKSGVSLNYHTLALFHIK